jgi:hypothetical protein
MKFELFCFNEYDHQVWDQQAYDLGGTFFHCYASGVYNAMIIGGEPLFIEARDENDSCVCIALGVISVPRFWPFSKYSRIATFAATPVANGNLELERLFLERMERRLKEMGIFSIQFDSYDSENSNPKY